MSFALRVPMLTALLVANPSCSSETCVSGATQVCHCPSGKQGAQSCVTEGTGWGPCLCEGNIDAGPDDSHTPDARPPGAEAGVPTPDRSVAPDGCVPETETCNGVDENCNGIVDDLPAGTPNTWRGYRDTDGDGFGTASSAAWLCEPQPGWTQKPGDCDDKRKDVNPDMTEVCGDGVDNDCNGVKEDTEVCGSTPALVGDASDLTDPGAVLKTCGMGTVSSELDVIALAAKQDKLNIRFTARLAGAPSTTTCASYVLRLGTFQKVYEMIYVFRPAGAPCSGLPQLEAYLKGMKVTPGATATVNGSDVSFLIPKTEYFPSLSTPSYYLKVCTNAVADAFKDVTDCASDSCETPVHR